MSWISDSRESPDSRESGCESIRANHAAKFLRSSKTLRSRRPPYRPPIFNLESDQKNRPKKCEKSNFFVTFFAYFWPILGSAVIFCPVESRSLHNDNKNLSTTKVALSKFYCHGVSQEKNSVLGRFSSLPPIIPPPPRKKGKFCFFIVVSPSLILRGSRCSQPKVALEGKKGTICPFGVFPPNFIALLILAQFAGNPCSEGNCGVVTFSLVLQAFQVALGPWNPNSPFVLFGPEYGLFQNTTF